MSPDFHMLSVANPVAYLNFLLIFADQLEGDYGVSDRSDCSEIFSARKRDVPAVHEAIIRQRRLLLTAQR
jgi:hypothetical protein